MPEFDNETLRRISDELTQIADRLSRMEDRLVLLAQRLAENAQEQSVSSPATGAPSDGQFHHTLTRLLRGSGEND